MLERYLKMILNSRVYDVACETPLVHAERLSQRLGNDIRMKREDLQPVHSFKCRGAYNKVAGLSDDECAGGVIAASAGNHAQGVALAANKRGIRAVIVMPRTTPSIKVDAVRHYGARIVLEGDAYDDAYAHARVLADEEGMVFIHPYDDPEVIAGQGTVGLEILREHRGELHAVFVPVGGGGLIAGVAACIKALQPSIRVIGVEPDEAPCMYEALQRGRRDFASRRLDHHVIHEKRVQHPVSLSSVKVHAPDVDRSIEVRRKGSGIIQPIVASFSHL